MNTPGDTIGTAPPRPTRHKSALPIAADQVVQRRHTAAHAAQIPRRPPAGEETTRQPRGHLVPPEAPTMDVKPAAAEPTAQYTPPTPVGRARRRKRCRTARLLQRTPNAYGLALAAHDVEHEH